MIVVKNLERVIDESRSVAVDSGGELEHYLIPIVEVALLQAGIKCVIVVEK